MHLVSQKLSSLLYKGKEKERKEKKRKEMRRMKGKKRKEKKGKKRKGKKSKGKNGKEKERKEKERKEKEREGRKERKGKKRKGKKRKGKKSKGKNRKEKKRKEKERNEKKRNEKIPDPQNCFGGVAIKQSPQIVWGGEGGVPYTNQHPTLYGNNGSLDPGTYEGLVHPITITLHSRSGPAKLKTPCENPPFLARFVP